MRFSKYNNPSKRRNHRKMSRTDADIFAAKNMLNDRARGVELPLSFYDAQSDAMCGKSSRHLYEEA